MPVVVTNPQVAPKAGNPLVGYIILGLLAILLLIGLIILLVWLVSKIVKYIKQRSDLYYNLRKRMFALTSMHCQTKVHRFRINKNLPIRLVYPQNGQVKISPPVAFYGGHFYSNGSMIMRFFSESFKMFFFIPKEEILIINCEPKREIQVQDVDGNSKNIMLDVPINLVQFNETEVLLYAYGITNADSEGIFFYPQLYTKAGTPIDMGIVAFETMKNITLGDALLGTSRLFVQSNKLAVEYNPSVRIHTKLGDTSQSLDNQPSPIQQPKY